MSTAREPLSTFVRSTLSNEVFVNPAASLVPVGFDTCTAEAVRERGLEYLDLCTPRGAASVAETVSRLC